LLKEQWKDVEYTLAGTSKHRRNDLKNLHNVGEKPRSEMIRAKKKLPTRFTKHHVGNDTRIMIRCASLGEESRREKSVGQTET
jgi:hypothetical protein